MPVNAGLFGRPVADPEEGGASHAHEIRHCGPDRRVDPALRGAWSSASGAAGEEVADAMGHRAPSCISPLFRETIGCLLTKCGEQESEAFEKMDIGS
ncbi:hypothetical protein [Salinibacter altiplanensis]|uniref:hypothetical protein n=1 Tax=Salinibacter altiplanensis TaxID=1803181 RepID=UPI0018E4898A|nr:hypothetical protein [Salinibacter altiplanensis]